MNRTERFAGVAGLIAAMALAGCGPPGSAKPAVDTAKIADAVKADEVQLTADFNAHDVAKVVSHDAPGVVQMYHGAPNFIGVDGDTENNKEFFKASPDTKFSDTGGTVDVAASGDMAVYRSTYTLTLTDPKTNKPVTDTGNYLAGYKPQPDGSWKMTWSVLSDTPPAAPAAPDKKS